MVFSMWILQLQDCRHIMPSLIPFFPVVYRLPIFPSIFYMFPVYSRHFKTFLVLHDFRWESWGIKEYRCFRHLFRTEHPRHRFSSPRISSPLIIILGYYSPTQTVAFFISLVGALPPRPLYDYAVNFPVANANAGETTRNMGGEHESVAKPHVPV